MHATLKLLLVICCFFQAKSQDLPPWFNVPWNPGFTLTFPITTTPSTATDASITIPKPASVGNSFAWQGWHFWVNADQNRKKQDCTWTKWTTVSKCEQVGEYTFKYKQNRTQIPAKDGGKPCIGPSERFVQCDDLEHVALSFKYTVGSAASDVRANTGPFRRLHTTLGGATGVKCANDHVDKNGTKRMMGVPCKAGNRSRRAIEDQRNWIIQQQLSRRKRQAITSLKHRDVTLLIDESGSVGPERFKKFMRLGKALVNSFCKAISVSKQQTRVGIMTFDRKQHYHLDFDQFFDKVQILDHMDKIPYNSGTHGSTCLVEALKKTRREMITKKRGARVDNPTTTERVVVMMTDGCANCNSNQRDIIDDLKKWRGKFEEKNIPFITFFVGDDNRCVEIMQKGLANGALCYQVFRAMNWEELDQMTTAIEQSECMDAWTIGPSCPS